MSKHRPTYEYVCTYLCFRPLFVWSPRAQVRKYPINMQALSLRASHVALRLSAVTLCHYSHHAIKSHIFISLNTNTLCSVRCVFLLMLDTFNISKGQHVTLTCIHRRLCLCRCVVCLSLFHGAKLVRYFIPASFFALNIFMTNINFRYISVFTRDTARKKIFLMG